MKLPYAAVLSLREFRLLVTARLVSQLGNQASVAVIPFAVLSIRGGAGGIGFVLGAESLALGLFLLVGGVIGDRWSRRRIMIAADLIRLVTQGLTAALLILGQAQLWQLVVLQFLSGIASALYIPAVTALSAETVGTEQRASANSLRSVVNASSTIAGPALGGLLAALMGPGQALALDAASFLISAMLEARLRVGDAPSSASQRVLQQAREGWREFSSRRWLWSITLLTSLVGICVLAPVMVLGPVIAQRDLGGVGTWATTLSALGVGAVVGGVLINTVHPRRPLVWIVLGTLLLLPIVLLLALRAPKWPLFLGAFLMGIDQSGYWALWQSTLQRRIPADVLSRVSSYDWLGLYALGPLGYLLIPVLAAAIGPYLALAAGGAVIFVAVIVLLLVRAIRSLNPDGEPSPLDPVTNTT